MDAARTVARGIALGRVAFGVGMLVAPRAVTRPWIGADGDRPGATVLTRGLGARDLLLGLLALHTIDHPQVGPRYVRATAACDAADLAATLAVRSHLTSSALAGTAVIAGGAVLGGLWAGGRM